MPDQFTIDQVAWHTKIQGNTETRDQTIERFYAIATFLQENGLTLEPPIREKSEIGDDFAIHTDNLTEEGYAFMKAAYDGWLTRIDGGMPSANVSSLEKALRKIRGN